MIFVTVGAQMAFDRLIARVDDWAGERGRDDVFAQIGPSDYKARHVETSQFLQPREFNDNVSRCSAMVGHAGMGTIITALQNGKPLLVFPRIGALGETRNDHQTATARRFGESGRILVAFDEDELMELLDQVERFAPQQQIGAQASAELLDKIRSFSFGK